MNLIYDTIGIYAAVAMGGLATLFALSIRPWWGRTYVRAWVASFALMGLGLALFIFPIREGTTLGLILLASRNGCLLLGAGYQLFGWSRVLGQSWPWTLAWGPVALLLPPYLLLGTTYPRRVLIVSLVMGLVALGQAVALLRAFPGPFLRLGAMARMLFSAHGVFCLLRAFATGIGGGQESLFRWTAYAFFEFSLIFSLLAYLEWGWVEQWEEAAAKADLRC
ncbi:MAG: hypothetical protein HYZ13_15080 [Acidobacteria bacterium]|nr:hypothetical protein [Acidobacteriota bacterium]